MLPVTFKVSYRLVEYVQFWRGQFVAQAQAESDRKHEPVTRHVGWISLGIALLVAPPVFFYKVRKVGQCEFTIDANSISRVSNVGTLAYPWSKVVAIRQFKPGYLIATGSGAMPIPYRVLTVEQGLEMAKLISRRCESRNPLFLNDFRVISDGGVSRELVQWKAISGRLRTTADGHRRLLPRPT